MNTEEFTGIELVSIGEPVIKLTRLSVWWLEGLGVVIGKSYIDGVDTVVAYKAEKDIEAIEVATQMHKDWHTASRVIANAVEKQFYKRERE